MKTGKYNKLQYHHLDISDVTGHSDGFWTVDVETGEKDCTHCSHADIPHADLTTETEHCDGMTHHVDSHTSTEHTNITEHLDSYSGYMEE